MWAVEPEKVGTGILEKHDSQDHHQGRRSFARQFDVYARPVLPVFGFRGRENAGPAVFLDRAALWVGTGRRIWPV